jgi:catechol 2,3-dioxygenase-like lactoylglutathione lyase family enzyme
MELYHVAVFVDDLEKSALAPALGGWVGSLQQIAGQPAAAGGRPVEITGRTRRVRTAGNPDFSISIEDMVPGAPIRPAPGNAWHHVALWCDDIAATVQALEDQGYERDVVGRGPNGELTTFAYMISARGPRLELSDAAMQTRVLAYFAQDNAGDASEDTLVTPSSPYELATVVESAEDLEALRLCWTRALGAEWSKVTDSAVTVLTTDGERALRMRTVRSAGNPYVTIIAPDPASRALLAPVGAGGWHHVGFRSNDLPRDVASLKRLGFTMEFCDRGEDGPLSFAMMAAPEGTRIKLATA